MWGSTRRNGRWRGCIPEGKQIERHGELSAELAGYAGILEEHLDLFEKQPEGAEEKVAELGFLLDKIT
ncbi:MAG: hypothetical protein LBO65_06725 [Spirochaetaceae bacterium]|jgi:hypothetical protein|nr:hypothetical protein [Spirochaetaceae bacterium]